MKIVLTPIETVCYSLPPRNTAGLSEAIRQAGLKKSVAEGDEN